MLLSFYQICVDTNHLEKKMSSITDILYFFSYSFLRIFLDNFRKKQKPAFFIMFASHCFTLEKSFLKVPHRNCIPDSKSDV